MEEKLAAEEVRDMPRKIASLFSRLCTTALPCVSFPLHHIGLR